MDTMICGICGGLVQWIGPFEEFTATKCVRCGAINPPLKNYGDDHMIEEGDYDVSE